MNWSFSLAGELTLGLSLWWGIYPSESGPETAPLSMKLPLADESLQIKAGSGFLTQS